MKALKHWQPLFLLLSPAEKRSILAHYLQSPKSVKKAQIFRQWMQNADQNSTLHQAPSIVQKNLMADLCFFWLFRQIPNARAIHLIEQPESAGLRLRLARILSARGATTLAQELYQSSLEPSYSLPWPPFIVPSGHPPPPIKSLWDQISILQNRLFLNPAPIPSEWLIHWNQSTLHSFHSIPSSLKKKYERFWRIHHHLACEEPSEALRLAKGFQPEPAERHAWQHILCLIYWLNQSWEDCAKIAAVIPSFSALPIHIQPSGLEWQILCAAQQEKWETILKFTPLISHPMIYTYRAIACFHLGQQAEAARWCRMNAHRGHHHKPYLLASRILELIMALDQDQYFLSVHLWRSLYRLLKTWDQPIQQFLNAWMDPLKNQIRKPIDPKVDLPADAFALPKGMYLYHFRSLAALRLDLWKIRSSSH